MPRRVNNIADPTKDFAELAIHGLVAVQTTGDGNCLFRALSEQITGDHGKHEEIRAAVVTHLREHPEDYKSFLAVIGDERRGPRRASAKQATLDERTVDEKAATKAWEVYLKKMAKSGTYGTHLEIAAFARVYQTDVFVFASPGIEYNQVSAGAAERQAFIAHHVSYQHFSSVRAIGGPVSGLPHIKWGKVGGFVVERPANDGQATAAAAKETDDESKGDDKPNGNKRSSPSDDDDDEADNGSQRSSKRQKSSEPETSPAPVPAKRITIKLRLAKKPARSSPAPVPVSPPTPTFAPVVPPRRRRLISGKELKEREKSRRSSSFSSSSPASKPSPPPKQKQRLEREAGPLNKVLETVKKATTFFTREQLSGMKVGRHSKKGGLGD